MRYSIVNSLLFLAVSPLGVIARPVDPNDLAGQWDPSGQYRKGQWQHGVFVANNGDNSSNKNGQANQNGQVDQNGQWRDNNNNNQSGQYNQNSQQNNQNGWTDANGQWHATNQNVPNDQNGQEGWTNANDGTVQSRDGQNDNQNNQNGWTGENGWTDENGQWHAGQKPQAIPTTTENDRLNEACDNNKVNTPHRRSWRNNNN
ncbi:hypothetical protein PITC_041510 [Penicillium italicum]|uniref:Uncharacterized protein n=1 Tax=Penicillium italicum TaxID=40296 RepID=A0A0A2LPB1_PENIT|nr:hypothetical protein PITC_041510 [Penicillium italicum]